MGLSSDIIIVGSGVIGCSIARELSRFQADIIVLEKANDVCDGASKANSGIVHAGYDALSGSLKARYNVRGASLFPTLCKKLNVPYHQCGALVVGFTAEDRSTLRQLLERGQKNGVQGLSILDTEQMLSLEPNLNPEAECALSVPTSAIVSPYELSYALADDAALNGVHFELNETVSDVRKEKDGTFIVQTDHRVFTSRVFINAAGSGSAEIHNRLSPDRKKIIHRKGEYYLLDRQKPLPFSHTVFQCPTIMGKGVLLSPTVHGNLIIGPNAEDIEDPDDKSTTGPGLDYVIEKARKTWPSLSVRTNITNFGGIRAHLEGGDFMVGPVPGCAGAFEAMGIESPGLSSAPAIALELCGMVAEHLSLEAKDRIVPLSEHEKPFSEMTAEEKETAVRRDPQYGNIICRCETVTEAEIRSAIRRPVGASTIDGVKRRVRAGMGRCQGGFCLPRVAAIIAEEKGIPLTEVKKGNGDSYILSDTIEHCLQERKGVDLG